MTRPQWRGRTSTAVAAFTALLAAAFIAVGFVGVNRYGRNYWLYRGFPPPADPAYVTVPGTEDKIDVTSPALGGRAQPVYVYLPPGYDTHQDERSNRARRIVAAREQDEVGARANGLHRPLSSVAADDGQRVGDRDAVEAEAA